MLSHAGLPHNCTFWSTVIDPPPILKVMYLDGPLASLLITVSSHYGTMNIYVNTTQKLESKLPGLENQVWWVKEFFYGADRTLPTQLTISQHGIMLFTRVFLISGLVNTSLRYSSLNLSLTYFVYHWALLLFD